MENVEFLGAIPHGRLPNGGVKHDLFNKRWELQQSLETKYNQKNAAEMFKELKEHFRERKIRYIVATFSGGHDEGGIDDIEFQDSLNNEIKKFKKFPEVNVVKHEVNEFDRRNYTYYVLKTTHQNIVNINNDYHLRDLIYSTGALDKYGSFAFEGNVEGTITIDVEFGKWFNSANESYEQYEQTEEEGELDVSK